MMRNKRNRKIGAGMAEFAPALFIFFMIVLFPMINLACMATGASTVYLAAVQCATKASEETTFGIALSAAKARADNMMNSGFANFAKLQPVGGFNGCGMDLYITRTDINTNVSTTTGPNVPYTAGTIDPNNFLYAYDAVVTADVGPFMNLSAVPFIGNVPGIGVPARLSYKVSRNVEHPEGLTSGNGLNGAPPGNDDYDDSSGKGMNPNQNNNNQ